MDLKSLFIFLRACPLRLVFGIERETVRFYRTCFLSSFLGQPFAKRMAETFMPASEIARLLGMPEESGELSAWLDFGVSVGAFQRKGPRYRLKGGFPRRLAAGGPVWRAFYRIRVEVMHAHILKTPEMLSRGERFGFDDAHGELYAQSSRTVEPVLTEIAGEIAGPPGPRSMLEAGCGAGVYIRAACQANPELTVVGLERQHSAAMLARKNIEMWGLTDRARIVEADFRAYEAKSPFDIVTLHNMIYYFPHAERLLVLRRARSLLRPGGRIVLSTLYRIEAPSILGMNLWTSMNQGSGPLPLKGEMENLLDQAGFTGVHRRELIPGMYCFTALA